MTTSATPPTACIYGVPSPDLVETPQGAVQVSSLIPGSADLATLSPDSLSSIVIAAPPGTLERRYVLALALRALRPGGAFTVLAPTDKGGARIGKELAAFGCAVVETGRRHQRICTGVKAGGLEGLDAAIAAGGPARLPGLELWTQPGVFSWDRIDPGTTILLSRLPALGGRGADLGCGIGVIAKAVLASTKVTDLHLVDVDRRAVEAARRNVEDPRAHWHWTDARTAPALEGLDFIVCNPPFHDDGAEDRSLGQAIIRRAREMLRPGGVLWMVANRHLPYEAVLGDAFARVTRQAEGGGYKVYEARR
jgi:16S rRNA (guanine1207-N2)-methyltransferase